MQLFQKAKALDGIKGISSLRYGFKTSDHAQGPGAGRFESAARLRRMSILRGMQSACGGPSGVRRGYETSSMPYSTGRLLGAFSGDCCDRSAAGGLRSEACGDFTSPLCGEIRLAGSPGMGCCEVCRGASTRCRGGCGDAGDGAAACSCRCRGTGRVVDGAASGLRDGRAESSGFDGSAVCSCRCRCCIGRLAGAAASGLRVG
jgi:hypothetical protein